MKTNNENRRGSGASGASRDGNSFEKRDVKSILKGKSGNFHSNDNRGDRRPNSGNDRNDGYKPRFSDKKIDNRSDKPTYGDNRNSDNNNRSYNSDRKPFVSRDNRNSDSNARPYNSDRKPFVSRDNRNSDDNARPYNSDRKPFLNKDNRNADGNTRPHNSDRKPFLNKDNRSSDGNARTYNSDRKPFVSRDNRNADGNTRPYSSDRKPYGSRDDRNDDRRFSSDKPRFVKKDESGDRPAFKKSYDDDEPRDGKLKFRKADEVGKSEFVETRFDNKSNGVTFRKRNKDDNYDPNAKYSKKKQIEYKTSNIDPNKPVRLNKFLANAGICSRREADEYIQAGVISVNGEIVNELGTKILPTDKVLFHNQTVRSERKIYLLLNKPKDCVTTSEDTHAKLTVLDLVKNACSERIYPVGRLDRNTTGVMLLTNDGDLASKLTHPKYNKKKIYHVVLDHELAKADFNKILEGIDLEDFTIKADALEFVKEDSMKEVGIEIHTGQNRVVRRIFEKLGYKIVRLDRVYFAGLTKKNVPRGKYRFLTEREVNMLKMGSHE